MKRLAAPMALVLAFFTVHLPAFACVGRTLVVGTESSAESRLTAQLIAILINERTGTTVKIQNYPDGEQLYQQLRGGEVDIAVQYAGKALGRLGKEIPADSATAFNEVKAVYQEELNLVWLPPLGFQGATPGDGPAAPVAKKETLKKFPALPRLIAKTQDLLDDATLAQLASDGDPAKVARAFLRERKLI